MRHPYSYRYESLNAGGGIFGHFGIGRGHGRGLGRGS
jgi:hypothetical protein